LWNQAENFFVAVACEVFYTAAYFEIDVSMREQRCGLFPELYDIVVSLVKGADLNVAPDLGKCV
jgi:hypothetical protein